MTAVNRPNIFDFEDYRAYLRAVLEADRTVRRGAQARLAEALGCQSAYLSMVLAGKSMLSAEQAAAAAHHFTLTEQEAHYLMLMVLRDRAGTEKLRRYYDAQIAGVKADRQVLARRLKGTTALAPEHMATFYGAWYFRAIHIALTVPALQTMETLEAYLGLPRETVVRALEFLVEAGLATREGVRYVVGPTRTHLEQSSPFATTSHAQARIRTLTALSLPRPENFHYSSVVSAAPQDMPKLREIMMRAIEEMRAIVRDSPEEGVFCYGMDLFSLKV